MINQRVSGYSTTFVSIYSGRFIGETLAEVCGSNLTISTVKKSRHTLPRLFALYESPSDLGLSTVRLFLNGNADATLCNPMFRSARYSGRDDFHYGVQLRSTQRHNGAAGGGATHLAAATGYQSPKVWPRPAARGVPRHLLLATRQGPAKSVLRSLRSGVSYTSAEVLRGPMDQRDALPSEH